MKRGVPYNTLETDSLIKLLKMGVESDVLRARLRWAAAEGFRRYVAPLVGVTNVTPNYLPTQSSGRWSVTGPPLINFPDSAKAAKKKLPDLQQIFEPHIGTWWLCSDWDAMHAVFMACMSDDEEDIVAFRDRLDLHTSTACRMFRLPLPPSLANPHTSPESSEWRASIGWMGKGDRRRHLAKTVRYALLNAYDWKGVLEAKEFEEQGLTIDELITAAKAFLRAKPGMVRWKEAYARDAIAKGEARSLLGRRRKLFGANTPEGYREKFKLAVAHFLQGTEVDIMETTLLAVSERFPESHLAWPSHDGLKFVFPTSMPVEIVHPVVKAIVERPWRIGKHEVPLYATWEVVREGGQHLKL